MNKTNKLYLVSLGCNKNLVDSEIMLGKLKSYEITTKIDEADVIIVNTCGFIESAKQESVSTILSMIDEKKDGSTLVVTGCLMQRYKDELIKELPEVDLFTGVGDYHKIDEIIAKKNNLFSPSTYLQSDDERIITGSNYHAYIKISEGCNQRCSFCAIPTFKGKLQSRALNDIVNEVKSLVKKGYYDFSFLSQDSSSYLKDKNIDDGLVELIESIENIDGVKSARILYLYPTTTSNKLIQKIIDSKVFHNYFDMPIQHISDNMLKIMRRGAKESRVKEILNMMRQAPNSFLRTGIIVGHPGESDEDFDIMYKFLKEFKFDRISAFSYSKEEDTKAYEMEQIDDDIKAKRLDMIESVISNCIDDSFLKIVGNEVIVSLEGESSEGDLFYGAKIDIWDKDIDGEVLINESDVKDLEVGARYLCQISEVAKDKLLGKIVKKI